MERVRYNDLLAWKKSKNRKPLILYGARQVGKSWLLDAFGKGEFKQVLHLNFDTEDGLAPIFGGNISPERIIAALSAYYKTEINPADTLLIFDEIQASQRAKDSLKYFNEKAPQYHIAAAGSFLGVASGKFPVGQVDELTLFPMSFAEFLEASGESRMLDILRSQDPALINALAERFTELLKTYMYVGGMPAAVKTYIETNDPQKVRTEQNAILNNYKNDFANHIPAKDLPKVRMIWDSIPYHLAKEKKKFVYKEIKTGGRAAEFENAMDWLVNTALVYRVDRTTSPKLPLSSYGEREHFKLYFLDVGLLGAKAMLDISTLMLPNNSVFTEFKGALTEQYALQELKANTALPVFYWGNDSGKAEVDFIMQYKNEIVPIEAKSAISTKSQSLSVYLEKYKSARAVRTSLKPFSKDGRTYAVPLYMIGEIERVLADGGSLL